MDILNWLNWKKAGRIVSSVTSNGLIPVGEPDPTRDDKYLTVGITVADFAASLNVGKVVDEEGNVIIANSSENTVDVANGASHLIPDFSGMLLVNDHYDGSVETWIAGGGSTVLLGNNISGNTLNISGTGYEWTNVDNLLGPFTFTVIKTRNEA
jgi:hypothetical protein